MSIILAFVLLAAIVGGCKIGPMVGLLIVAAAVAALWKSRLNKRHCEASRIGTHGGNAETLFDTTFWVVFGTVILFPPLVPVLVIAAFFIRTSP